MDKRGAGWIMCKIDKLVKVSGLSITSVYRVLTQLQDNKWLYSYELKGNNSNNKGYVYIKYVSDRNIVKDKINTNNSLYIVAPLKLLRDKKAIKARCYLGEMNRAQSIVESKLSYSIGKRKISGELLSLSTIKKENKQLVKGRANKGKVTPLDRPSYDIVYPSNNSNNSSDINPVLSNTTSTKQQHISYAIKGQRGVKIVNSTKYKVAAITSQTLAKKLCVNRRTVDKYLQQFKANRVKLYKRVSLIEATTEAPYVLWDIDEDRGICDAYRPLPFLYTKNVLHTHQRDLIKRPLISYLNDDQLEVAKLCAITKGYSYDNEGAETYLKKTGLSRFRRNTNSISDKPLKYNPHYLYKGQLTTEPEDVYF